MKVFTQSTITILNRIQQSEKLSKNNTKCGSRRMEYSTKTLKNQQTPDIGLNIIFHVLFFSIWFGGGVCSYTFRCVCIWYMCIEMSGIDKLDMEMEHSLWRMRSILSFLTCYVLIDSVHWYRNLAWTIELGWHIPA